MRFAGRVAAAIVGGLVLAAPVAAEHQGYLVNVVGRVVSADRVHGTIVLHHAMLETADAADVHCTVPRTVSRWIRPGMTVTAVADTSRHPWRLVRVAPLRPPSAPPVTDSPRNGALAQR